MQQASAGWHYLCGKESLVVAQASLAPGVQVALRHGAVLHGSVRVVVWACGDVLKGLAATGH